jgi:hypothetical protein
MTESPAQPVEPSKSDKQKPRRKLLDIARRLQTISDELIELVKELEEAQESVSNPDNSGILSPTNFEQVVGELRAEGREISAEKLQKWKQPDLARLFMHLGGPSRDKKKPKDWIIERILWQVFDFQSGHELLKDEKTS